jgi:dsDNA-specific endonuclease/ATPase MutS2
MQQHNIMLKWLSQLLRHSPKTSRQEEPEPSYNEDEPVQFPITAELDLHTFSPKDIVEVTKSYLEEARRANFAQVRIIHGKGKGVQRESVHAILKKHPFVQSFQLAPPERGGWGATLVWINLGGVID